MSIATIFVRCLFVNKAALFFLICGGIVAAVMFLAFIEGYIWLGACFFALMMVMSFFTFLNTAETIIMYLYAALSFKRMGRFTRLINKTGLPYCSKRGIVLAYRDYINDPVKLLLAAESL